MALFLFSTLELPATTSGQRDPFKKPPGTTGGKKGKTGKQGRDPFRKPPVLKKAQKPFLTITTKIKGKKQPTQPAKKKKKSSSSGSSRFMRPGWSTPSPVPTKPQWKRTPSRKFGKALSKKTRSNRKRPYRCAQRENSACLDEWKACRLDGNAATIMCAGAGMTTGGLFTGGNPLDISIGGLLFTAGCATYYWASCRSTYSACTSHVNTT